MYDVKNELTNNYNKQITISQEVNSFGQWNLVS